MSQRCSIANILKYKSRISIVELVALVQPSDRFRAERCRLLIGLVAIGYIKANEAVAGRGSASTDG